MPLQLPFDGKTLHNDDRMLHNDGSGHGRAFADAEFGKQPHTVNFEGIPYVVATIPEAATIGLTETQARETLGESVRCYKKTFQPLFNLIGEAEQEAMLKLVVDSNSDRMLGVHMVGECAAEVRAQSKRDETTF
jgi:glutathione reductase (NADPH)